MIREEQRLSASQLQTGHERLRAMLNTLAIEGQLLPAMVHYPVYTVPAGPARMQLTLGKTGSDITGEPPSELRSIEYLPAGAQDGHTLVQIPHTDWIDQYTTNTYFPGQFYFENAWPQAIIYFDRAVKQDDILKVSGWRRYAEPVLADRVDQSYPPEFERPFYLALAVDLQPSFAPKAVLQPTTLLEADRLKKVLRGRQTDDAPIRHDPALTHSSKRRGGYYGQSGFGLRIW